MITSSISTIPAKKPWGAKKWEAEDADEKQKEQEARNAEAAYRAIAKEMNDNREQVPFLHLSADVFLYITAFLTYGDVVRLSRTCHRARSMLLWKVVWAQQLRFFHEEVALLNDNMLLYTDLLHKSIQERRPSPAWSMYDLFRLEYRLYAADLKRKWFYKAISPVEDMKTGVYSVELHAGGRVLQSGVDAPLSRAVEAPSHEDPNLVYRTPMGSVLIDKKTPLLPVKILTLVSEEVREILQTSQRFLNPTQFRENIPTPSLVALLEHLSTTATELMRCPTPIDQPPHYVSGGPDSGMRLVQLSEDFKDDPVEQCYREALLQTLTSARRRRVHLGSHHRAIRNNGRGTRNRLDGQRPTQAELNEGNYTYPINALLENFKGLLLEITETEARGVCQDILHKPYLVDDFLLRNVMYPKKEKGHQASYSDSGVMNDARSDAEITAAVCNDTLVHYYLMPEVVNNVEEGICVGLLVVDPVRLLLVVEKEKEEGEQTTIPDITLEQIQQVLPNGRFFNPGLGYNRQT